MCLTIKKLSLPYVNGFSQTTDYGTKFLNMKGLDIEYSNQLSSHFFRSFKAKV